MSKPVRYNETSRSPQSRIQVYFAARSVFFFVNTERRIVLELAYHSALTKFSIRLVVARGRPTVVDRHFYRVLIVEVVLEGAGNWPFDSFPSLRFIHLVAKLSRI